MVIIFGQVFQTFNDFKTCLDYNGKRRHNFKGGKKTTVFILINTLGVCGHTFVRSVLDKLRNFALGGHKKGWVH